MKATLTSKGQVTIPVGIRRRLGLRAGTVLDFDETASCLVARRVVDAKAWGRFGRTARNPWPGKTAAEIVEELRGPVELPPEAPRADRR